MEELRSTDILDKEIQADARKKAEKVIQNADAECKTVLDGVDKRVNDVTAQKSAFYKAKLESFEHDSDAALPLEEERFLVSFDAHSVADAINEYLDTIGQEGRLKLIKKMFKKMKPVISGKKINAFVFGFNLPDAQKFLSEEIGENLLSCKETSFEKSGEVSASFNKVHEGIILETEDLFIRCRLTIDELAGEIEDKYSYELASTLFGGRLPE